MTHYPSFDPRLATYVEHPLAFGHAGIIRVASHSDTALLLVRGYRFPRAVGRVEPDDLVVFEKLAS